MIEEINDFQGIYYSNPKLYKKMKDKEELIKNLMDKAYKCPYCKDGHFLWEDNGGDYYGYQSWLECNKCGECGTPYRQSMIEDVNWYPDWDFRINNWICDFEAPLEYQKFGEDMVGFPYEKMREFDPKIFDEEKHTVNHWNDKTNKWETKVLVWKELVEEEVSDYIKTLNKIIEKAKKYKLLKRIVDNYKNRKEAK